LKRADGADDRAGIDLDFPHLSDFTDGNATEQEYEEHDRLLLLLIMTLATYLAGVTHRAYRLPVPSVIDCPNAASSKRGSTLAAVP
jgi:hypothetical protein